MPLASNPKNCLIFLGKQLKHLREQGEQFCAFAFDSMEHDFLEPDPRNVDRDELPFDGENPPPNWNAAFYKDVAPSHTERAILEVFGQWISDYQSTYGTPKALYIYSFLIPCMRDGDHGNCADNIFFLIVWAKQTYGVETVYVAWSNDDRSSDDAHAIRNLLADLEDEGIGGELFKVSIAN